MTVRTQKLAETKAKATVKNDQLDTPDSSTQATPPPARQRPRKSTKSKSSKSNSSKQALAQSELISRMPVEVFAEFASYLQPVDLISLARTNRFFRRILMSFSKGTRIWQTAERNIDGLPSCPPGLCEPQYAAFMFINACSECGAHTVRRMDPYLWVRLCPGCRDKLLIRALDTIENIDLVSKSNTAMPPKAGSVWYSLKRDLDAVKFEMDIVATAVEIKGKDALAEWRVERNRMLKERNKVAQQIIAFYKTADSKRKDDRSNIAEQRRIEIEQRLRLADWSEEDLDFSGAHSQPWTGYVSEAKPITDRSWAKLYPKLVECLERKREANSKRDIEQQHAARRLRVHILLSTIYLAPTPVAQVNVELSADDMEPGLAATPLNSPIRFLPLYQHRPPFPSTAEVFTWDPVKEWLDEDMTVEAMVSEFEERRGTIESAVREWQAKVEKEVLAIWREGPENTPPPIGQVARHAGQIPAYTITYGKSDGTTTTNIKDLSTDAQLLLRADTVFKSLFLIKAAGSLFHTRGVVFYPTFVPGPTGREVFETGNLRMGRIWDASQLKRHEEGCHVARVLLRCLGLPDATYAELAALGDRFTCARCCEVMPESWEQLVTHFLIEQELWERGQRGIAMQPGCGVVFRNVHDMDPKANTKPLVKILTTREAKALRTREALPRSELIPCPVCKSIGTYCDMYPQAWVEHHMEVHNIPNPPPPPRFRPDDEW